MVLKPVLLKYEQNGYKKGYKMGEKDQELEELKDFVLREMNKVYWDSMNQSIKECLDSGDVSRETIEPHPDPMTDQSIEEWGQRNFPARREVEKGEIIFSRWDGFVQRAQRASNKCYLNILRDFEELERELNPPPPRQPDSEVTPDNIPEELIEKFANDAWETDSGAVDWEKTFERLMDFDQGGLVQILEFWTSEVTYVIREENDFKGPLDYGSKTLRKIQKLVREERQ